MITEFESVRGNYAAYDLALDQWRRLVKNSDDAKQHARQIAAGLARLWQAALLITYAPTCVVDAFVASRLSACYGISGEQPLAESARLILAARLA